MQGKVAIVTGGGSGIGEGIVRRLGAKGVKVVATGRSQAKLDRVGEAVRESMDYSSIAVDITAGDAFLKYLSVYPPDTIAHDSKAQVAKNVAAIWNVCACS